MEHLTTRVGMGNMVRGNIKVGVSNIGKALWEFFCEPTQPNIYCLFKWSRVSCQYQNMYQLIKLGNQVMSSGKITSTVSKGASKLRGSKLNICKMGGVQSANPWTLFNLNTRPIPKCL
jgi:hypothetical protein